MKNDLNDLFWNSSLADIKKGYIYNERSEEYTCLICGKCLLKGNIYNQDNNYYEAERFMQRHIYQGHGSVFEFLIDMDKKYTGLTKHQKKLLFYFFQGYDDKEIIDELGGGSTSTIRNYRFTFREKAKQAKVYLALMDLLEERLQDREKFINIHRGATMVDERYAITKEEEEKIINKYFKDGPDGPISVFPSKEKRKIVILKNIIKRFDINREYTEKEVNQVLEGVHSDYVTIRRYLIEYGFMDRIKDGSSYWVNI